jgi:hypothetical protein
MDCRMCEHYIQGCVEGPACKLDVCVETSNKEK